jgi:hypothetical protein
MNKTIKLVLLAVSAAMSFAVNAQGFQIGYIKPTSTISIGGSESTSTLDGIQAGITSETNIQGPVSLQYGLLYSYLFGSRTIITEFKTTAHNIDLPVRVAYKIPVAGEINAYLYGGPSLSYALSNKTKTTILGNEITSNLYGDNSDYSQFNLQAGVGVAFEVKSVILKVGYDWGLLDLNKSSNVTMKTDAFTASVGIAL